MKTESFLRRKIKSLENKMEREDGLTDREMTIYKTIKWVLREGNLPKNKKIWK